MKLLHCYLASLTWLATGASRTLAALVAAASCLWASGSAGPAGRDGPVALSVAMP
jgi:hypothetical protein